LVQLLKSDSAVQKKNDNQRGPEAALPEAVASRNAIFAAL